MIASRVMDCFKLNSGFNFVAVCLLFLFSSSIQAIHKQESSGNEISKTYTFYINPDNYRAYTEYLDGRDPLDITEFENKGFYRHTWELYVFQTALVLGGCNCKIEYLPAEFRSSYARNIIDVNGGRNVSHPVATYLLDNVTSEDSIYFSDPVLNGEDFYVGLYTEKNRKDILQLTDIEKIKALRYTSVSSWVVDNHVLSDLMVDVIEADDWLSMVKMIKASRSDIVLQPFSRNIDEGYTNDSTNNTLMPIKNVKVLFNCSRQYVVSKKHPDGKAFITALNKGIKILHGNGLLRKAGKAAGFFRTDIDDWQALQPTPAPCTAEHQRLFHGGD